MTLDEFKQILPCYLGTKVEVNSKLQLRRLESMTDENLKQLKKYMRQTNEYWTDKDTYDFIYPHRENLVEVHLSDATRSINWLRQNGFDCDNLIDSGFAEEVK